jgi:hypothetical protein
MGLFPLVLLVPSCFLHNPKFPATYCHAGILLGLFNPEDGGDMFLQNVDRLPTDCMELYHSILHNHHSESLKSYTHLLSFGICLPYCIRAFQPNCIYMYLGEREQKPPDGGNHNAAHQKEGDVLRPKRYVNIDSNPVDCYFHASCNRVFLSHSIKNNVDG